MSGKRKKKREFPLTGILVGLVAALAVCAAVLGWFVIQREHSRNIRQAEDTQEAELQKSEQAGDAAADPGAGDEIDLIIETEPEPAETEAESLTEQEPVGETEVGSKTETEAGTEPESMAETEPVTEPGAETEAGSEIETAAETEPVAETEPESEIESETESESESESETETEPETEAAEKLVVAIDPGHQGSWVNMSDLEPLAPGSSEMKAKATTGTQGPFSGKAEYELNLEISLLLRSELEARGYEVILTREDNDAAISNSERALMAYEQGGDIYVRIHANGSDDPGVNGALAMVPSASNPYVGYLADDSYLLADCILDSYCAKAGFSSLGIQYYDNMTGINWSKLPVMILEMGFMTNQSDDLRMADASVQQTMAEGIADGIDSYFEQKGMKKKEAPQEAMERLSGLLERLEEEEIAPARAQGEEWAVSLLDLETGAEGDLDGDRQMKSASVIKVFLMAAIYDRVCYPSSEERHITFGETYEGELKQLITDMITVSDNTAANTLLERLGGGDAQAGMAVVNQFCEENGYTATVMGRKFLEENPSGDNYTSANDCRRLLQSIRTGTCVCQEASAKMFEYLKNQTRRNKIPAGLPQTAFASNKTGELAGEYGDYVENDIAVIEEDGREYILCVLSGSLLDNGAAINRIARIAGTVSSVF